MMLSSEENEEDSMMKKKMVDERIRKESNALLAKFYWVMLALQAVVLAVKLCLEPEVVYWVLDALIILAGLGVMIVLRMVKGLWGQKDEALREIDNGVLSTSFGTMLWVTLIGSEILIFGDVENALWYGTTILPLLICCAIYTVLVVKRGLILWGGKQNEGNTKKRLRTSTA